MKLFSFVKIWLEINICLVHFLFAVVWHMNIATAFNPAFEYAIRNVEENYDGMELNEAHKLLVYADVNLISKT